MWKCNVSVKCWELDTCTVEGSGHRTDFSFVGGGWSVLLGNVLFLFHLSTAVRRDCVFPHLLGPQNAACPTSTPKSKCFSGVFVAKAVPLSVCMCWGWKSKLQRSITKERPVELEEHDHPPHNLCCRRVEWYQNFKKGEGGRLVPTGKRERERANVAAFTAERSRSQHFWPVSP